MFVSLKECGVDIILNNMEIKYETLSLFKELPIDEIKLTAEYVNNNSNLNMDILKNVVKLCNHMEYKVTIGSIESEGELIKSIKSGANKIQGNFLFKKMEETGVEDFLNKYSEYQERIDKIIVNAKKTELLE